MTDTLDTVETLVGFTFGGIVAVAAGGAIGLFYLGRFVTWLWRR